MDIDLRRYDEFPAARAEAYEEAVAKALGTRTLDQLRAVTRDGIVVPPIGGPRDMCGPVSGRAAGRPWSVIQMVHVLEPDAANAQILDELTGGADGVDLVVPSYTSLSGLPDDALVESLVRVFAGVYLDMIEVHFTGVASPLRIAHLLPKVAERLGRPVVPSRLFAGFDPFAAAVSAGGDLVDGLQRGSTELTTILAATAAADGSSLVSHRGELWHALGASDLQQIALAVATGRSYLGALAATGADGDALERLAGRIEFRLVADQNQFLSMARIRAFRRIWALLLDSFGIEQVPARIHVETSWRMMTRRDPWVNILRSTIAVFAAAVAGADSIATRPHTALVGKPDAAARRLSRNVQAVLLNESNLHRVADPAAGAGGLEDLTDQLAEKGFELFREIERDGGLAAALASGSLLARIADADAAERDLVARRKIPVTGVSTYPLLTEAAATVEDGDPLPPPAPGAKTLAAPFEALRDRSDAVLAETGARPSLFLATIGTPASHGARATWARNVFAAGGIECLGGTRYAVSDLAAAFESAGARVACIVGDDATYAVEAAAAAEALAAGGASVILVAGRPPKGEDAWDSRLVTRFVHEGLDMADLLAKLIGTCAGSPEGSKP